MINDKPSKQRSMSSLKRNHLIFYISMFILPGIQFSIFYIGINFVSIQRAFTMYEINYDLNIMQQSFAGFENFRLAIELFAKNVYMLKTTFIMFGITIILSQPLCMIVSYYIFKKKPLSGFFKVMVFLPHVISGLVFALLFRYITENVYVAVAQTLTGKNAVGLLVNPGTRLGTVLFFNIWLGLGADLLLFSGAMNNVGDSVLEAAQIDGANLIQEFLFVVFPGIFTTYKQMLVLAMAGIFTGQMSLMSLFGIHSDITRELSTVGMFFYIKTYYAGTQLVDGVSYSVLSAFGLLMTFILVPVTFILKHLLTKYGPSTD